MISPLVPWRLQSSLNRSALLLWQEYHPNLSAPFRCYSVGRTSGCGCIRRDFRFSSSFCHLYSLCSCDERTSEPRESTWYEPPSRGLKRVEKAVMVSPCFSSRISIFTITWFRISMKFCRLCCLHRSITLNGVLEKRFLPVFVVTILHPHQGIRVALSGHLHLFVFQLQ